MPDSIRNIYNASLSYTEMAKVLKISATLTTREGVDRLVFAITQLKPHLEFEHDLIGEKDPTYEGDR